MALLLYDGNCRFCVRLLTRFQGWLRPGVSAVALQDFASADLRLQSDELRKAITYVSGEEVSRGAEAIANAIGGIARVYYVPGVRQFADWGYRVVARQRHLMPGGCEASSVVPKV